MLSVYKKSNIIAITILIVCAIFLSSCNQKVEPGKCSINISVDANNLLDRARNIFPDDGSDVITSYVVTLDGPNNQKIEKTFTGETNSIDDLVIGYWTISVNAMNNFDKVLSSGKKIIYLTNNVNNVEISLDKLEGIGSAFITYNWQGDQVNETDNLDIIYTIASLEGQKTILNDDCILDIFKEGNSADLLINNIAAGSYVVSSKLMSNGVCIAGMVTPMKIVSGGDSSDLLYFLVGDKDNHFSLQIISNVLLPVDGTITSTIESPTVDTDFTLTFVPNELPIGISISDLHYQWYYEGSIIEAATTSTITTNTPLGIHRYDLIINLENKGSIGGISVQVNTII
ncbi:MAG: hypothetical protein JJE21_02880 [Spirochaetaceae bacterium]|nr:hypothetical protein [Spirochaetaceae bacterium]